MEKWNEFKVNYPKGFYFKEYKDYTFVVYQHQSSGHLNGYVELKPIDEELLDQKPNQQIRLSWWDYLPR